MKLPLVFLAVTGRNVNDLHASRRVRPALWQRQSRCRSALLQAEVSLRRALWPSRSLGRSAFCWRSGRVRPPRGYGREGKGQPNLAWPGPGTFLKSSRALGGGRA